MSAVVKFVTEYGEFTVAKFNGKVDVPCFGCDPFACDCKMGQLGICYARNIAKRYATAAQSWKNNERILDKLKPSELYQLFFAILNWTYHAEGKKRFRGWVAGEPSLMAAKALAGAASDFNLVRVWIPSATLRQDMLNGRERRKTIIRSSLGNKAAEYSSQVIKSAKDAPRKEVVCPHECGECIACWDPKVKRVNYVEHR